VNRIGRRTGLITGLTGGLLLSLTAAAAPPPEKVDFFETSVRPIFAEHCYQCHSQSAEKLKGGLRLDSPEDILKGGKSGPAIVPGHTEQSRLIKAVRYTDAHLKMPPEGKRLSAAQVSSLETWVEMGAPLPAPGPRQASLREVSVARSRHWAFRPLEKPAIPPVNQAEWVRTPVDHFVLALLEKNKLHPAPPADRRTLIRRVTYDLIGLPPTPNEVDTFLSDGKSDAYSRLVERLLASPHYGERWGRYWLDIARYADTKGYLAGGEERRYAFSYTYRDYVIQAYNEDKPYDQFITEQLAADELPRGTDKSSLAALGFLTLGRRFLNNQNDIIDDRIDVVTRGTMGLTVACARCHDHKFDPIPTRDYYSLHGVFASSHEPAELPLLAELHDSPEYQDYLKQKEKIEGEIQAFKQKQVDKFLGELRQRVGDYLLGAHEAESVKDAKNFDTFAGEHKLNPVVLRRWMAELEKRRNTQDPIFGPWFKLEGLTNWPQAVSGTLGQIAADTNINLLVSKSFQGSVSNSLHDAAQVYSRTFKQVDNDWAVALAKAAEEHKSSPEALSDPEREALRQVLYAENSPVRLPTSEAESILAQPINDGIAPLRNKIEALNWTHPGAPPRAMALVDRPSPSNSHVLLRGNQATPGPEVPRRFLEVLSPVERLPFTNGSGRLELARAIVSPENPLTARVYVNRVWMHHFGEAIVKTPGDFGVRTEAPAERLLLDYLASSLIEHGWSTKYLHRLIVLSAAYQQSCESSAESLSADPENNLYSHMNRQRLDFESLRDTLLCVSGKLDPKVGGLPVDIESEPFSTRRTVYGLIDRQNLPGIFRTFDFANPDTSSQLRFHTTVPQQALFLMNSPFVIEQARGLASRSEVCQAKEPADTVQALYHSVFQRRAQPEEVALGEKFLEAPSVANSKLSPLEKYAQVLLLSNELLFID
jgi:mono/diheme cytochrome c family protein